ncbi:MAG: peroxiredoxin [Verrucomicrobiales bacterium]|jgi:peroxiredoxin
MNAEPPPDERLIPEEGWHVLHVFYHIDHANWSILSEADRLQAKTHLTELAWEIRTHPKTQFLLFSIVSPKADLGCLILTPDLHDLNAFEKRLTQSLGPDILTPVYSYLSMTQRQADLEPDSVRDEQDLNPTMPDWSVVAFYPIAMRRSTDNNWFTLEAAARRKLLEAHREAASPWNGKVRQMITGSTGLDDADFGVTQFANDATHVRELAARTRLEKFSSVYAESGEVYIGIQLALDELFRRLGI